MGSPTKTQSDENDLRFDEATLHFIEELGMFFEEYGVARAAGRIIGLLMITPQALNQEQIANILQISRAAASTNVQLGQTYGLVRIVPRRKAGDRRDYYEIAEGSWEKAFLQAQQKVKIFEKLASDGLKIVDPTNKLAQKRLREMEALFACLTEWWQSFDEVWQKRKAELHLDE